MCGQRHLFGQTKMMYGWVHGAAVSRTSLVRRTLIFLIWVLDFIDTS